MHGDSADVPNSHPDRVAASNQSPPSQKLAREWPEELFDGDKQWWAQLHRKMNRELAEEHAVILGLDDIEYRLAALGEIVHGLNLAEADTNPPIIITGELIYMEEVLDDPSTDEAP